MINMPLLRPNSNNRMDASYLNNFKLALINWELNRQEDRKKTILKKERKVAQ
jgi:hypothetical protein